MSARGGHGAARRIGTLAVAALAALAPAGCGLDGVTLPGAAPHGPSYRVTAEFADVLDLVPQAAVKVNDVTVGSVEKIGLSGWHARVRMRIDKSVRLPTDATAELRQTSLLGEKFVALAAPAGGPAAGTLGDGAVIPLSRTGRSAEVEEVLAALGLLLNGGGLAQLQTIDVELNRAMHGREGELRDLLGQLDTFLGGLDRQKADITRALDAMDRLTGRLARDRATIGHALDALGPGLTVLADQRAQLTRALTSLSRLSTVGTRVVEASRDATLADLAALKPILTQLAHAGDNLPKALEFMLTYPFPPNVEGAIRGNFVNMYATMDLDGAVVLSNLLVRPGAGATGPGQIIPPGAAPAVPVPGAPALPVPVPTLPGGLPSPTLTPLPTISPSLPVPSVSLPGCGPLGEIVGCG
jgi:phospholipid/cholesterol/gamma-HCH transport system substrate-binding protein